MKIQDLYANPKYWGSYGVQNIIPSYPKYLVTFHNDSKASYSYDQYIHLRKLKTDQWKLG